MSKYNKACLKYGNAVRAQLGNINTPPDNGIKLESRRLRWLDRINLMQKPVPEVSLFCLMP